MSLSWFSPFSLDFSGDIRYLCKYIRLYGITGKRYGEIQDRLRIQTLGRSARGD